MIDTTRDLIHGNASAVPTGDAFENKGVAATACCRLGGPVLSVAGI